MDRTAAVLEENLKKALMELMVLALLHERDYHVPELTQALASRSEGAVNVAFPYAALYRMIEDGFVQELPKRKAPDGRRRQYFGITEAGRQYFRDIWAVYRTFTAGTDRLVASVFPDEVKGGEKS